MEISAFTEQPHCYWPSCLAFWKSEVSYFYLATCLFTIDTLLDHILYVVICTSSTYNYKIFLICLIDIQSSTLATMTIHGSLQKFIILKIINVLCNSGIYSHTMVGTAASTELHLMTLPSSNKISCNCNYSYFHYTIMYHQRCLVHVTM